MSHQKANPVVGRPRLGLVRFTVVTSAEVKDQLIQQARRNGRSLSVEAGRLLTEALAQVQAEALRSTDRPEH